MKYLCRLYILALLLGVGVLSACSDDDNDVPSQPSFIIKTPDVLTAESGEVFELSVPAIATATEYVWTVPEHLEILDGQGTVSIQVKAWAKGGTIAEKMISVYAKNAYGDSRIRYLYKEIALLLPPPTLDKYPSKRYGAKTWMTVNLNEKGDDGNLGRAYNNDEEMAKVYGRLYTWDEAVTGISRCTPEENPYKWGSSGIDDAGNPYTLDGSPANSFNIQIQGACPEGWHIPNTYDWYDLLVAIKSDYGLTASTLNDVAANMSGYIIAWDRNNGFTTGLNLTNWGFVGAYLKGSGPATAGGLWSGGTTFSYGGNAVFPNSSNYPLYLEDRVAIGFNILPGGQWTGSAFNNLGLYSYHWSFYLPAEDKPWRLTVASGNVNLSNAASASTYGYNVRCVANY